MALTGVIVSAIGAALILVDVAEQWRRTTTVIDGGHADTDFTAEERKAKMRALASTIGPALVLVGTLLSALAL